MRAKIYEAELIAEGTLHGSCIVKSRKVPNKRLDYRCSTLSNCLAEASVGLSDLGISYAEIYRGGKNCTTYTYRMREKDKKHWKRNKERNSICHRVGNTFVR